MAGLLYFVPGLNGPDLAKLDAAGLGPIFGNRAPTARQTTEGPDGSAGVVLVAHAEADGATEPRCGYYPADQRWAKAVCGTYWIGIQTDSPPAPVDLQRKQIFAGHAVRLEDGNDWIVPLARIFPQGSVLPKRLILGPDGKVIQEALPRFAAISAKAQRVWDGWRAAFAEMAAVAGADTEEDTESAEGGEDLDPLTDADEAFAFAAEVLGLNYRLTSKELSFLSLMTTENLTNLDGTGVLDAVVDMPSFLRLAGAGRSKKNETPDGSSSADGGPDS